MFSPSTSAQIPPAPELINRTPSNQKLQARKRTAKYKLVYQPKENELWVYGSLIDQSCHRCFQKMARIIRDHLNDDKEIHLHIYNIKFNTSAAKGLMNVFNLMKRHAQPKVTWHVDFTDTMMLDVVYEFSALYNFKLFLRPIA